MNRLSAPAPSGCSELVDTGPPPFPAAYRNPPEGTNRSVMRLPLAVGSENIREPRQPIHDQPNVLRGWRKGVDPNPLPLRLPSMAESLARRCDSHRCSLAAP